jgi:hypothetical protein
LKLEGSRSTASASCHGSPRPLMERTHLPHPEVPRASGASKGAGRMSSQGNLILPTHSRGRSAELYPRRRIRAYTRPHPRPRGGALARRRLCGAGSGACGVRLVSRRIGGCAALGPPPPERTTVRTSREASASPPTGTTARCHGLALRAGLRAAMRDGKSRRGRPGDHPGDGAPRRSAEPGTKIAAAGAGTVPETKQLTRCRPGARHPLVFGRGSSLTLPPAAIAAREREAAPAKPAPCRAAAAAIALPHPPRRMRTHPPR